MVFFSRDNLPNEIKDGAIYNKSWWIFWYWYLLGFFVCKKNDITYFDSFGVEHIPKEIIKFNGNKNIKINIFRIQTYDLIVCGYFCIGFINFRFKGKTLTDYTNIFSPNNFKKNNDIILNYLNNAYI